MGFGVERLGQTPMEDGRPLQVSLFERHRVKGRDFDAEVPRSIELDKVYEAVIWHIDD